MKNYKTRLIALLMVAACMLACFTGCASGGAPADDTAETVIEHSPEFDAVFAENAITWVDAKFDDLSSTAFVMESDSGLIECFEFGYKSDVICAYVDTVYLDISEYTEEDKDALDATMRETFASVEVLDYVDITYTMLDEHYVVRVSVDGLDDVEILQEIVSYGIIAVETMTEDGEVTVLSMQQTESGLTAQGYIKR